MPVDKKIFIELIFEAETACGITADAEFAHAIMSAAVRYFALHEKTHITPKQFQAALFTEVTAHQAESDPVPRENLQ